MTGRITDSENSVRPRSGRAQESYNNLKDCIRRLYPEGLPEKESDEATRNFIGFGKLMLEIKRQNGLDDNDEE